MKKYRVRVREVWTQDYILEAESEAEAIAQVDDCNVEPQDDTFDMANVLDTSTWEVVQVDDSTPCPKLRT